jgi:hypothetical protein
MHNARTPVSVSGFRRVMTKSRAGTLVAADVSDARNKIQAAQDRRARRNAKRAREAAKVGG